MTLTFEERLTRLGKVNLLWDLHYSLILITNIFLAETDLNMERIRTIEKCFGNDNQVRFK